MDVIASIGVAKSAMDLIGKAVELVKKSDDGELKKTVIALQTEMLKLSQENLALAQRNMELENQAKVRAELKFDGVFYWAGDDHKPANGPFCSRCYDVEKRTVRLKNDWSDHFSCPACNNSFAGPNAKIELAKPIQMERYDSINSDDY